MWKAIPGYEGLYEANDETGRIRSLPRSILSTTGQQYSIKGRILRCNKIKNGYLVVYLRKDKTTHPEYVHRLIAKTYIQNPNNYAVVNHKDGNKSNCAANNLEWVSYAMNNQHAYDNNLREKGEHHYKSKLTDEDVKSIRRDGKYATYEEIAAKYNVTKATIRDVLINRTWKHIA